MLMYHLSYEWSWVPCIVTLIDQYIQGCMADYAWLRPLMLWVNLPFVDTIHSQSNKFVTGAKIKVTGDSNLTTAQISHALSSLTWHSVFQVLVFEWFILAFYAITDVYSHQELLLTISPYLLLKVSRYGDFLYESECIIITLGGYVYN